jgi:hypothetical protein
MLMKVTRVGDCNSLDLAGAFGSHFEIPPSPRHLHLSGQLTLGLMDWKPPIQAAHVLSYTLMLLAAPLQSLLENTSIT